MAAMAVKCECLETKKVHETWTFFKVVDSYITIVLDIATAIAVLRISDRV